MNKLTYQEIKEIINSALFEKHDHEPSRWMFNDVYTTSGPINDEDFKAEFEKLGSFKMVDRYGGEGQGDDYFSVFHFIDHNVYIKFDGWYQSHEGAEYSSMRQVEPVEKIITDWKHI